jgi:hypothetical protein
MSEINIAGADYQIGKLDAFKQSHIFIKLSPVLAALATGGVELRELPRNADNKPDIGAIVKVLAVPMAEALANMPDEQRENIMYMCLAAVQRKSNGQWAPIKAAGARALMFQDIDGAILIRLVVEVITENLGGFFSLLQLADSHSEEEAKA